ncbi:hypothetical protein IKW72_07745 [bacterium]|nr:hypothetical protein [bacterium]
MAKMTRFGVSLEEGLLLNFDKKIADAGYRNRSAALRDLVRKFLNANSSAAPEDKIFAVVSMIVRSSPEILGELAKTKRKLNDLIRGSQIVHEENEYFLDLTIFYGKAEEVIPAAEKLTSIKGILSSQTQFADTKPPCHK